MCEQLADGAYVGSGRPPDRADALVWGAERADAMDQRQGAGQGALRGCGDASLRCSA